MRLVFDTRIPDRNAPGPDASLQMTDQAWSWFRAVFIWECGIALEHERKI